MLGKLSGVNITSHPKFGKMSILFWHCFLLLGIEGYTRISGHFVNLELLTIL